MILAFNYAQTFYIEKDWNANPTVKITGVDIFFKYKPQAINNRSGIVNPGITLYLAETIYDVPKITQDTFTKFARAEWSQIITSSDATVPTRFEFQTPIEVQTGKKYAYIASFDGNETFWPWTAKTGMWLVNSRVIYPGPGSFTGNYFEFTTTDTANDPVSAANQAEYTSYWRKLTDTQSKFKVYVARYFINGQSVLNATLPANTIIYANNFTQISFSNNSLDYITSSQNMEHVTFDLANSQVMEFVGAQRVFQNTVHHPGGFANNSTYIAVATNDQSNLITANANYPNGTAFNWNTVYGGYTGVKYIVLQDTIKKNVRMVSSILSNTQLQVTEPVTFTNTLTKFFISPIATVDSFDVNSPRGKKTEFLMLKDSNANSTVRFVNNCVEAISVTTGGSGYSNADVLYVKGFENVVGKVSGGYVAVANIGTNSTGGITNIYFSNLGCGFVNTSLMVATVANSTSIGNVVSNTSAGSGATFAYTVGATLQTELSNNIFKHCSLVNLDVNDATPFFSMFTPAGTTYQIAINSQYYVVNDANTYIGLNYMVYPGKQIFSNIQLLKRNRFLTDKVPCFVSRSNEFNMHYSNGSINDTVGNGLTSNNMQVQVHTTTNNDYIIASIDSSPTVEFGKYIINNDYTLEETNSGNCWAKHITTRNTFARLSEDIRVYLDAYRPSNTDIQVYARIQNSGDTQPFDDEDWTRLELEVIGNSAPLSSISKEDNYVELIYKFQNYPNTAFTLGGVVATSNNSNAITGSNTTFQSNLAVGNLVRIYDPLFPANNHIVAMVGSITNNTSLTIDELILSTTNPALVGPGLKIEKLNFKNQAFNHVYNDSIVRYYNDTLVKFDGYDNLQIKVCLLSSQLLHYPKIHDIRVVGISA